MVGQCWQELRLSKEEMVCTKTLYNWIGKGLLKVRNIDLPIKVRLKPRKTKPRVAKIKPRGKSIEERKEAANNRKEFGHWEKNTSCRHAFFRECIGYSNREENTI
ncbi:hypothetical protein Csac_2443 [Caldicellulosiruptor saccharolyticus DSM 8903]|uniref:Uncharacterized protein n=1 Tax=Caldicellulosiruptor saccharolyticus (strain ATCC 43494 / DSM 8903 / Tp8T 6331) TaxID=351627 RepID=A4XM85_CALS8|nr:hypothetical protein [Caldicellulosiruptor saccharolyticus]ABP68020.1 hypothetical protein Csac_2443 [Caldicellulosiruptor saccharolyticus DSM 8903]